MKRFLVPVLALAALTAACDDKESTGISTTTTANVRFVNAVSGSGNLALTANGSMVGSPQGFGPNSTTCSMVNTSTGTTAFAFGTANSGGTGISSNLNTFSQALTAGGNYTVIATGSASSPGYIFLNNTPTTSATAGNANLRFVNATGAATSFDVFTTSGASLSTATAAMTGLNGTSNNTGSFMSTAIGNNTITFTTAGSKTPVFSTTASQLSSGGSYTLVLLPGATAGTYQTLLLNSSCT